MNKLREDDMIGKIKADSITSITKIRSIEAVPGMPWVYQVFAAKELHARSSEGSGTSRPFASETRSGRSRCSLVHLKGTGVLTDSSRSSREASSN
jgi:hypothetical protein